MAVKSIIDIQVNDQTFKNFHALFQQYSTALTKQPAQWAQVGSAIRSNAQGFQAIVNALVAQTAVLAQVQQTQHKETTELDRQDKLWARIARNTRGVYHDVLGATEALVKWTGLTTIFTGLLGAGSLYGLERIAETIGESRRTALGYGVGIGQQRAFGLDFGRFVNDPNQLLGGVAGAMLDIASPGYAGLVGGAGFSPEFLKQNNAAQVSAALLDKIPQIFAGLSDQMIQSRLTATGLDQLGLTSFDVKRLRDMQPEEREQQKRYLEDTTAFKLDDATAKQFQDLDTQLQRAGRTIFTVLVQGLTPLTDPLKKLSTSVVDVVGTFLKAAKDKDWIGTISKQLDKFADDLKDPKFGESVKSFVDNVGILADTTATIVKWLEDHLPGMNIASATKDVNDATAAYKQFGVAGAVKELITPNDPVPGSIAAWWKRRWDDLLITDYSFSDRFAASQQQTTFADRFVTAPPTAKVPAGTLPSLDAMLELVRRLERSGTNAISPKDAVGTYQIEPGTAKLYGFDPTNLSDPAYNKKVAEAIVADLMKKYNNNIKDVLVAYNAGPGRVQQFNKFGESAIPKETREYLHRATKLIGGDDFRTSSVDKTKAAPSYPAWIHGAAAATWGRTRIEINQQTASNIWTTVATLSPAGAAATPK